MLQSFLQSLAGFKALWLIWASLGVLVLAMGIVLASVMRYADEPLHGADEPRNDDKLIV
jgi:hypothetical protein